MTQILDQLLLSTLISHQSYVIAQNLLQSGGLQGEAWVEDWLVNVYNLKIRKTYSL